MPPTRTHSLRNGGNVSQLRQEPMYIPSSDSDDDDQGMPATAERAPPLQRRAPPPPVSQRRRSQGADPANPILLSSDEEDNAEDAGPAEARVDPRRLPPPERFRRDMEALDAAIGRARRFELRRREAAMRARDNPPDAQPLNQRNPELAARYEEFREAVRELGLASEWPEGRPRPFGGAVLRRGPVQINYRPDQPAQARVRLDDADYEEDIPPNREGRHWLGMGLRHRVGGAVTDPNHPDFDAGRRAQRFANQDRAPGIDHGVLNFINALGRAVGPAGRGNDIKAILDGCKPEIPAAPAGGFTRIWEAEDLVKEVEENEKKGVVLELDDYGRVVPDKTKPRGQPYLACAACPEPLRVGSAGRSDDDRVWALRCGHLLDERCYKRYAQPGPDEPLLEDTEPPTKRRRSCRKKKKPTRSKLSRTWWCPVKGCGHEHVSILEEDTWVPKTDLGGIQVFV